MGPTKRFSTDTQVAGGRSLKPASELGLPSLSLITGLATEPSVSNIDRSRKGNKHRDGEVSWGHTDDWKMLFFGVMTLPICIGKRSLVFIKHLCSRHVLPHLCIYMLYRMCYKSSQEPWQWLYFHFLDKKSRLKEVKWFSQNCITKKLGAETAGSFYIKAHKLS